MAEKFLKRNMDDMLDMIYEPTEAYQNSQDIASVNAAFNHLTKVRGEIRANKRRRKSNLTGNESSQDM